MLMGTLRGELRQRVSILATKARQGRHAMAAMNHSEEPLRSFCGVVRVCYPVRFNARAWQLSARKWRKPSRGQAAAAGPLRDVYGHSGGL